MSCNNCAITSVNVLNATCTKTDDTEVLVVDLFKTLRDESIIKYRLL